MTIDAKTSQAREIYLQALRMDDDQARQSYLDDACGSETKLRARVEKLLRANALGGMGPLGKAVPAQESDFFAAGDHFAGVTGESDLPNTSAMVTSATDAAPNHSPIDVSTHPAIGRYKLLEEIGHGGMGTVYMAQQTEPVKRKVALKVIKPGMDTKEVITRFEAERQALAIMDHANIAKVLDGGSTAEGRPYFVMELVRGVPLTEFCKTQKLGLRERLELFIDICKAVQHAHQKGIIHRDLKPSNLLVTMHDHLPVVKVIDFGVAKALHQELTERTLFTQFSQMIGTPLYMAPEQAQMSGLDIDTRSDIYSLGVILYELLTGTTPFDRDTMSSLGMEGICKLLNEQDPPRPSVRLSTLKAEALSTVNEPRTIDSEAFAQQLQRELDWIVMKALEKDRERRYETAKAFADDVKRYLNDEAVEACPPSVSYQLRKHAKKHKGLLTTAALLVAMLVTSTAVSGLFAYQANEARIATEKSEQDAKAAKGKAEEKTVIATRLAGEAERSAESAKLAQQRELREKLVTQKALYISDVRLAAAKVESGSHSEALELLANHRFEQNGNGNLSWEWYYLLAKSHQSRLTWRAGSNSISAIDWSPDGGQIATASLDGTCRIWDATSGEELKQIQTNDEGDGILLSVKWNPDGNRIAWGGSIDTGDLRIWNSASDTTSRWDEKLGSVWDLAWNSHGTQLLMGSIPASNKVNLILWEKNGADWEVGARASTSDNISNVGWNADESYVGVVVESIRTIIFDAETLQESRRFDQFNSRCLDWHPSKGSVLAASTKGGELVIYDIESSEELRRFKPHIGEIRHFAWSPDGALLATAGRDGFVKIWDTSNWSLLNSFSGHSGIVNQVCWNPDSSEVASAGLDGVVNLWPLDRKQTSFRLESAANVHIGNRFVWTSNHLLQTVNGNGQVVDLSPMTGETKSSNRLEEHLRFGLVKENVVIRFGSDRNVVSAISRITPPMNFALPTEESNLKVTHVWGNPTGTSFAYTFNRAKSKVMLFAWSQRQSIQLGDQSIWVVKDVAWNSDDTKIAVVGSGAEQADGYSAHAGWLHIFNTDTGASISRRRIGSMRVRGTAATWSPDSERIVCATEDGLCEVLEFETGQLFVSRYIHRLSVNSLDWHPDGSRIASGSTDQTVAVWNAETGDVLLRFPVGESIQHIEWSRDGRMLAAKGDSGTIHVWDASEGYRYAGSSGFANRLADRASARFTMSIRNQDYELAAKICSQMIQYENDRGYQFLYFGALSSAYVDDLEGYRIASREMLSRYRLSKSPIETNFTAWACALAPNALNNYAPAIKLARFAVEADPDGQQYFGGLGAILMRAGNYDEAKVLLQKALNAAENDNSSPSYIYYFLAMTQHHLGDADAAAEHLTNANILAQKELDDSPLWNRKLTLELLRTEAEEMIGAVDGYDEEAN